MRARRISVAVDEALVRRVMRIYALPSKRSAIDFALRALVSDRRRRDMLDLEGAGWDADLAQFRMSRLDRS